MKKKKEYIIAGSLLSLAIVGMVFAYNTESGDKKSQEKEEQQVAFQEVEKDKETAKDEVEDVSSILKAKEKKEEQKQEQKQKAETQKEEVNVAKEEPKVQETASKPSALTFKGELAWPAAEEDKVIMNYSMDQTVYFKSLDQYRYNPAVIIGAKVNDKVTSAAAGSVLDVSNNRSNRMHRYREFRRRIQSNLRTVERSKQKSRRLCCSGGSSAISAKRQNITQKRAATYILNCKKMTSR